MPGYDGKNDRSNDHCGRNGHAAGGGEIVGGAKGEHQSNDADEHQPIHNRHINLNLLIVRHVDNRHQRQVTEPNRLAGQREYAGDDGLRCDVRGDGG